MENTLIGVPLHGVPAKDLQDKELLTEITKLSRIYYFLHDPRSVPQEHIMRKHYGAMLSDGKLQPLIDEARGRVAAGSEECTKFMTAADTLAKKYGGVRSGPEKDADAFICALPVVFSDAMARWSLKTNPELQAATDVITPYYNAPIIAPDAPIAPRPPRATLQPHVRAVIALAA